MHLYKIERFRRSSFEFRLASLRNVWISASFPLYVRAPRSFLLELRYLLIQWGYGKSEVRVDDKVMELKINGNMCCSAVAMEADFHIAWHDEFKTWTELQNDEEVKKLIDAAKKKLLRQGGKGKGKMKA